MSEDKNGQPEVPKKSGGSDDIALPFDSDKKEEKKNPAEKPAEKPVASTTAVVQKTKEPHFLEILHQKKLSALKNFLGDEQNAMRFLSSVAHAMNKIPALNACTSQSLIGAFMECAALRLFPGNANGDCYVIPYGNEAQFQLGYQGIKELALRSGVLRCWTGVVYEFDEWDEELGSNMSFHHKPALAKRGKAIGAYACAEINKGSVIHKFMKQDEIEQIKKLSKAAKSKYSPWNSENDPQKWMWQKTAFKQLAKMMPRSSEMIRAIHLDDVSERGGYIKAENEIVDVPFEDGEPVDKVEAGKDKKEALRQKKANSNQ